MTGAGAIAGIGFIVSLLIASLAFRGSQLAEAKVGILSAAVCASALGWVVFRLTAMRPERLRARALLGTADTIIDLAVPVDAERDHVRGPDGHAPGAAGELLRGAEPDAAGCRETASHQARRLTGPGPALSWCPCVGGGGMAAAADPGSVRDDRVLPVTRWLSVAIIPFLVVAFAVLYPFPHDTGRLFAWPVRPTLTPMILASVYLGGAYFFFRAAMAEQWHTVKGGFVPVGTFATLMGVATILHWGKFTHAHVAFWLWAGLYFTTPLLVFGVWWANRRRDLPAAGAELLIPVRVSRVIAVLGALSVLTALFLFLFPGWAAAVWPWMLTPLTARVMGAIFALGIAGLGAPADRRWSSARILLQVAGLMLVLILAAGARASGELDPSNAMTWLIGFGFAAVLAAIAVMYARMRARAAPSTMRG